MLFRPAAILASIGLLTGALLGGAFDARAAILPFKAEFNGSFVYLFLPGAFAQYVIERAAPEGDFELLENAPSGCTEACTYRDFYVDDGASYDYRIRVVYASGQVETFGPMRVDVTPPGGRWLQSGFAPNPMTGDSVLRFVVPAPLSRTGALSVSGEILDLTGRVVRRFAPSDFAIGRHSFAWDGRDEQGASVPAGAFFYRLSAKSADGAVTHESGRVLVLR